MKRQSGGRSERKGQKNEGWREWGREGGEDGREWVREVVKLCSSKCLGDLTTWGILTSSHALLVEQWNWRGERGGKERRGGRCVCCTM